MGLKRPFGLVEQFKQMHFWLVLLTFEMRTFAEETPQP